MVANDITFTLSPILASTILDNETEPVSGSSTADANAATSNSNSDQLQTLADRVNRVGKLYVQLAQSNEKIKWELFPGTNVPLTTFANVYENFAKGFFRNGYFLQEASVLLQPAQLNWLQRLDCQEKRRQKILAKNPAQEIFKEDVGQGLAYEARIDALENTLLTLLENEDGRREVMAAYIRDPNNIMLEKFLSDEQKQKIETCKQMYSNLSNAALPFSRTQALFIFKNLAKVEVPLTTRLTRILGFEDHEQSYWERGCDTEFDLMSRWEENDARDMMTVLEKQHGKKVAEALVQYFSRLGVEPTRHAAYEKVADLLKDTLAKGTKLHEYEKTTIEDSLIASMSVCNGNLQNLSEVSNLILNLENNLKQILTNNLTCSNVIVKALQKHILPSVHKLVVAGKKLYTNDLASFREFISQLNEIYEVVVNEEEMKAYGGGTFIGGNRGFNVDKVEHAFENLARLIETHNPDQNLFDACVEVAKQNYGSGVLAFAEAKEVYGDDPYLFNGFLEVVTSRDENDRSDWSNADRWVKNLANASKYYINDQGEVDSEIFDLLVNIGKKYGGKLTKIANTLEMYLEKDRPGVIEALNGLISDDKQVRKDWEYRLRFHG